MEFGVRWYWRRFGLPGLPAFFFEVEISIIDLQFGGNLTRLLRLFEETVGAGETLIDDGLEVVIEQSLLAIRDVGAYSPDHSELNGSH